MTNPPDWWQDKKNPDRHEIHSIPMMNESRIPEDWCKKPPAMETGADVLLDAFNPKNCELWRSEWARCVMNLPLHNQVNHRSYEKQERLRFLRHLKVLTQEKLNKNFTGQENKGSWKVAENQIIKQQNTRYCKDTGHLWKSIRCIIIMEGAIK
ncbi:MAG: hypothetical protein ACLUVM_03535 [Blautia faecis]